MPQRVAPMLALLADMPADSANWAFEFKWDGIRALAFWDGSALRLLSRNQLDITRRYPELNALGEALGRRTAILDGEILALDDTGRPSFARLQKRMHVNDPGAVARLTREVPIWYVLFDLLYINGRSVMHLPYTRRRRLLEGLTLEGPSWQITPSNVGAGEAMLKAVRENGMEGLVAKQLDSPYEPGRRSPAWRKIKIVHGQEFVVGGWIPEGGTRDSRVGSLLIGYYDCPRAGEKPVLHFAGGVGSGFTEATHARLFRLLEERAVPTSPFAERLPKRGVRFVRPELVIEVEFRRWPEGSHVQQAAFKGIRTDKAPQQVVKEFTGIPK